MILIAHRGNSKEYPENTLISIKSAIECGVNHVEIDVHLTRDGKIAVSHDDNLYIFTGNFTLLKDISMEEIKEISSEYFKKKGYSNLSIPEFCEVTEIIKDSKNCGLIVEIKKGERTYPGISRKLIDGIYRAKLKDRVIISSFDLYTIEYIRNRDNSINLSFLPRDEEPGRILNIFTSLKLHSIHLPVKKEGRIKGKYLADRGVSVYYYVVNEEKSLQMALEAKGKGIFTDDPCEIVNLLK